MSYLGEQDYEFVAPLAADCVGITHTSQQSFCNGLKQFVAFGMSQRIVDVFEAVQIQKEYCKRVILPASQGNRLCNPVIE